MATSRLSFRTFLWAAIFYEDPGPAPLSTEFRELTYEVTYIGFRPSQRCPYRATSCRAILHSDSTYRSPRQRYATGRRLLLAQCFTRLVADQPANRFDRHTQEIARHPLRSAQLIYLSSFVILPSRKWIPPFFLYFSFFLSSSSFFQLCFVYFYYASFLFIATYFVQFCTLKRNVIPFFLILPPLRSLF